MRVMKGCWPPRGAPSHAALRVLRSCVWIERGLPYNAKRWRADTDTVPVSAGGQGVLTGGERTSALTLFKLPGLCAGALGSGATRAAEIVSVGDMDGQAASCYRACGQLLAVAAPRTIRILRAAISSA